MCVCRDVCVAESRDPHWLTQEDTVREKFFFQIIHALHLAGRCTGCGQCARACPVSIPILALRRDLGRITAELFGGYAAGMNPSAVPPLLGYEAEEKHIHEREL
jgi:ferredoxin